MIEIVSRGSGERDTRVKPNRYEAIGIPEYWIFDPERHRIAGGLAGRLLADSTYTHAQPSPPRAGEVPVPPGTTAFWSDALGLYLLRRWEGFAVARAAHGATQELPRRDRIT